MSAAKKPSERPCRRCGVVTMMGASQRFCSDDCFREQVRERDRARHNKVPCPGCQGDKSGGRGRRYCEPCREKLLPIWQQAQIERDRRKYDVAFQARLIDGGRIQRRTRDVPEGHKWCSECQRILPLAEFAANKDKPAAYCRPCASDYNFHARLARVYGMTREQYDLLLEYQGGMCAICQRRPRKQRLAVDHNHKTGAVRGLLCVFCNHRLLGSAQENPDILRRAARYLDDPPAAAAWVAEQGETA